MTPIPRKPHDAGSHDQQMTPAVQAVIDAADKRMPAGCTTPDGCRQHGCHGACLPRDMTPAETAIRAALAAGPTPGPWSYNAWQDEASGIGGYSLLAGQEGYLLPLDSGCTSASADWEAEANAKLIAACNPAALAELLAELDGERNRSQMYADLVRGVAVVLHGEGWSDTSKLPEEVASLRAEVEALRADAERYRLLRNASMDERNRLEHYAGPALDAAIDTAKGGEYCRYPECECPFDAPADPTWCAKGLPRQAKGAAMADLPKPLPASEWQRDMWTADQLEAYADAKVAEERERAAMVCDDEARVRTEAGNQHPEDSESRSRCFAAARAAMNCAKGVRNGERVAAIRGTEAASKGEI